MVNWSNPVFPVSSGCWCLIQAPEPQPSPVLGPFWDTPCPACPYLTSDTSGPSPGWLHSHSARAGWEGACLAPTSTAAQEWQQLQSCAGLGKVWKTALVKEGSAWLAWEAAQSNSWWSRFCADKPFRRMAKALLNIWKLRLFTSEVYTFPRFGIFFSLQEQ